MRGAGILTRCCAIADVIGQQKLQAGPANLMHLVRFTFDLHAVLDWSCTGGDDPIGLSVCDFDQADHAGGGSVTAIQVTKAGYVHAEPASSIKNSAARRNFDLAIVNAYSRHYQLSVISYQISTFRSRLHRDFASLNISTFRSFIQPL